MAELSSGQRADKFRDDATRLRKKLELAIQETRVDDWAAERMIYVMDYLDTTLQGFFAFQDVLWNRFGDNGNALALQVGEILDRRLQYVQQENQKHLDASVGKLDDWIEEKKGLNDEIQNALKGLPELWAKTQMSDELGKVLPDVLEHLKNTLKDHPENLDTLLPLWNGFLNDAFQTWFPKASKTILTDLEKDESFKESVSAAWKTSAQKALEQAELGKQWPEVIQAAFSPDKKSGQAIIKNLQESVESALNDVMPEVVKNIGADTLDQQIGKQLESALRNAFERSGQDALEAALKPAVNGAINAYFLQHPLNLTPLTQSVDALSRKLTNMSADNESKQEAMNAAIESIREMQESQAIEIQKIFTFLTM